MLYCGGDKVKGSMFPGKYGMAATSGLECDGLLVWRTNSVEWMTQQQPVSFMS